jgi:hypothetical protein
MSAIDSTSIKQIIKESYKQYYAGIFDNLDEVDKFRERHIHTWLIQDEKDNSRVLNLVKKLNLEFKKYKQLKEKR